MECGLFTVNWFCPTVPNDLSHNDTELYIDTGQVSPPHGANVFISGPLSTVCGGGGGGGGDQLRNPHTSPFHSCLFLPFSRFRLFQSLKKV